MQTITKICKIEKCQFDNKNIRKGMCDKHYMSWWNKNRRKIRKVTPRHGLNTMSPEYTSWAEMKRRCKSSNRKESKNYKGRNITVCERWINNYPNFLEDMGKKPTPKHTLDRIDNDGDYSPENCRWATYKQQNNNRQTNHLITYKGKTKTIQQWCDILNIPDTTFHNRLRRGWSIEKTINE